MHITRLQPQTVEEVKGKVRVLSNSQQKSKSILHKKNYHLPFNKDQSHLINRQSNADCGYELSALEMKKKAQTYQSEPPMYGQKERGSKLSPTSFMSKAQRENFIGYVEAQIKNDCKDKSDKHIPSSKQQGRSTPKNAVSKLRLPLISKAHHSENSVKPSNNQTQRTEEEIRMSEFSNKRIEETIGTATKNSPSDNHGFQNLKKEQQSDFESKDKKTKQNSLFMNIKSVTPLEKISAAKRKDISMRELRGLRHQEQERVDKILEREESSSKLRRNQTSADKKNFTHSKNSRSKVSTVLVNRKNKLSDNPMASSSPLKLETDEKKRSQMNSMDKSGNLLMHNREKRTFSINQNKKKYAVSYMDFCMFMSVLNGYRYTNSPVASYKAMVGKGNNSILIKNAIKNRFWWNIVPEGNEADMNFLWLQNRGVSFINMLGDSYNSENTKQENSETEISSEKKLSSIKKQKFHLQNKGEQKVNEQIRQVVKTGFWKLMSDKQIERHSQSPFFCQLNSEKDFRTLEPCAKLKIHNHLEFNWNLTNKKALFYNLKTYYTLTNDDPFKYIPLTYHVKQYGDDSWEQFRSTYESILKESEGSQKDTKKKKRKDKEKLPMWIIKPGENSNQGCGIQVSDSLEEIKQMVHTKTTNGKNRSSIIQKYLMPFLYNKRKFDIRVFMLVTSVNGTLKGYWYEEGYIRTSCKEFNLKNLKNRLIHLTNDAIQKKSEDYGKYENGNKVSFADFQKYLDHSCPERNLNFFRTVYPAMMKLSKDTLSATYPSLNSKNREFTFQIFGLDFMIDEEFNTWLIEVNNNPCLELSSPLLARIIPNMIENAFKICLDPLFPPPTIIPKTKSTPSDLFESNKFTLIFSSDDIEKGLSNCIEQNKPELEGIVVEGEESDENDQEEQEDQKPKP